MERILECRKFHVVRERVPGRDGASHTREYVIHPGAVVVLPLLDAEWAVVVRQNRPAVGRELWELPAGTLDISGEPIEAAAAREVEEETGYRAQRLERLCSFFTSPGIMSEEITAFAATGLAPARQRLGPTEEIEVEVRSIADLMEMVRDGRITDAKTMITLLWWSMNDRVGSGVRGAPDKG